MREHKLPPLIEQTLRRISLIYEGFKLGSRYSANPYLPYHLRKQGLASKLLYKGLFIRELGIVKDSFLKEIEEENQCQE